ncbi:histone-lysine N-methyltransferase SETMAR [Trichonephila clavipes]|nr:histone-lysine N-methyltransferase SETMAR [Trichonephila clavipes]
MCPDDHSAHKLIRGIYKCKQLHVFGSFERIGHLKDRAVIFRFADAVRWVNSTRYCVILSKLKEAIRKKRHGLLKSGVLLLDDSAMETHNHITTLGWGRLHHSSYSPDFALSDFHVFPALKKNLIRRSFESNAEIKQAVKGFFRMQSPEFFLEEFLKPIKRVSQSYINVALLSNMSAIGDGPRNFEPWSNDEDDT